MGDPMDGAPAGGLDGGLGMLAVVCDLVARLYAAAPDEATLNALQQMDSDDDLALDEQDPAWAAGLRLIAVYCRRGPMERCVLDATGDHSRLFVGPLHVLAPPWSSVYLDNGMLYGPAAQRVAQLYKEFGLQVPHPGQEPEDHIAYELTFVALMNRRIAEALQAGDHARACEQARVLSAFCTDSLASWLEPFLARVEAGAETDLYRGLAQITRALVALEQRCLGSLMEVLGSSSVLRSPAAGKQ